MLIVSFIIKIKGQIMTTRKEYTTPSLTVHGNVETLTEAIGTTPRKDGVILNGEALGIPTDGSGDIIINT